MRAVVFTLGLGFSLSFWLAACSDGGGTSTTGTGGSTSSSTTAGTSTGSSTGSGGSGGGACDKLPAAGFEYAVKGDASKTLGDDLTMTFGPKGEPIFVYRDVVGPSTQWEMIRWDPCAGVFTAPVVVATVATTFGHAPPEKNASLSYDASKDRLALAYEVVDGAGTPNEEPALDFVTSTDGGKTWSAPKHVTGGNEPSVVAANGKVYFAYVLPTQRVMLEEGDGTTFSAPTEIPDDADAAEGPYYAPVTSPLSLALDSDNQPGLVFTSSGDNTGTYQVRVHYWHAGMKNSVSVLDSANTQEDYPTASLVFDGKKPRVVTPIPVAGSKASDAWFTASDDGVTWSAAVGLPSDAPDHTSWYQAIIVGPAGQITIAAHTTDPIQGGAFGAPKIWRSSDLKTFTVSAADATKTYTTFTATHVQAGHMAGKLLLAFSGPLAAGDGDGVIVWREP